MSLPLYSISILQSENDNPTRKRGGAGFVQSSFTHRVSNLVTASSGYQ